MFDELPSHFDFVPFLRLAYVCAPLFLFSLLVAVVDSVAAVVLGVGQVRPARRGVGEEGDDPDRQHVSSKIQEVSFLVMN